VAALAAATAARADGDPASDVLLVDSVYLPYGGVSKSAGERLRSTVSASAKAGYPVRVAVIAALPDLGAVTALWGKPREYAPFLALELRYLYKGPLVIVMPAGIGFAHGKQATRAQYAALAGIRVTPGPDGLASTAAEAVHALAAQAGHPFTASSSSGGSGVLWAVGTGVPVLVLAVAGFLFVRRRRGTGDVGP
jgi:hypothetical protein